MVLEVIKPDITAIHHKFEIEIIAKLDASLQSTIKGTLLARDRGTKLNEMGVKLYGDGKYDQALELFDGAVSYQPRASDIWFNRAICFYQLKRFPESAGSVERAIELDPRNASALTLKGVLLEDAGDAAEALECYKKAAEIDPKDPSIKANLGRLERSMQK